MYEKRMVVKTKFLSLTSLMHNEVQNYLIPFSALIFSLLQSQIHTYRWFLQNVIANMLFNVVHFLFGGRGQERFHPCKGSHTHTSRVGSIGLEKRRVGQWQGRWIRSDHWPQFCSPNCWVSITAKICKKP